MDAGTLYDAIIPVCPIETTTVVDPNDRATWSYVAKPEATPEQLAAADNVIATIPIDPLPILSIPEFIGRFTNAEYRAFTAAAWRQVAGNAKNADVVLFEPTVNLNKKKVVELKASLVEDGILTQVRADEIFS